MKTKYNMLDLVRINNSSTMWEIIEIKQCLSVYEDNSVVIVYKVRKLGGISIRLKTKYLNEIEIISKVV